MPLIRKDTILDGRYIIKGHTGSGRKSDTYEGADIPNNNKVAIKIHFKNDVKSLEMEYDRLRDLDDISTFITTPLDLCRDPPFLVLSLEGPSIVQLAVSQETQKLNMNQSIYVMFHSFTALNNLLNCGFCHGDTHMGNFLISKSPMKAPIIMIDFAEGAEATPKGILKDAKIFLQYLQRFTEEDGSNLFNKLLKILEVENQHEHELYNHMLNFIREQGFDEKAPSPI